MDDWNGRAGTQESALTRSAGFRDHADGDVRVGWPSGDHVLRGPGRPFWVLCVVQSALGLFFSSCLFNVVSFTHSSPI